MVIKQEIELSIEQSAARRAEQALENIKREQLGLAKAFNRGEVDVKGFRDEVDRLDKEARELNDTLDKLERTRNLNVNSEGLQNAADRAGRAATITSTGRGALEDTFSGLLEGDIGTLTQGLVDIGDTFGQLGESAGKAGGKVGGLASKFLSGGGLIAATGAAALAIGAAALAFKFLKDRANEIAELRGQFLEGAQDAARVLNQFKEGRASLEDVANAQSNLTNELSDQKAELERLNEIYADSEAGLNRIQKFFRRLFSPEEAKEVRKIEEQEKKVEKLVQQIDGFNDTLADAGVQAEVAAEQQNIKNEADAQAIEQQQRIIQEVADSTRTYDQYTRSISTGNAALTQSISLRQREAQLTQRNAQATVEYLEGVARVIDRQRGRETEFRTTSPERQRFAEGTTSTAGAVGNFDSFRNPFARAARAG